jgi:hypothetical protein
MALCAPLGGPLAVTSDSREESQDSYEFLLPRFAGIVQLPQRLSESLHAGEFGYVTIQGGRSESVAQVLSRRVRQWLQEKRERAQRD